MTNEKILSVISMSDHYHKTPAEIVYIEDEYEAFCFNEACHYISVMLSNKHKPNFNKAKAGKNSKDRGVQHYSRLSLLYDEIKKGG